MNAEQLTDLVKAIQNYVDERVAERTPDIDILVDHERYMQRTRADVDALANKLRDVVTALVAADGNLAERIERLDTFVMDSAFGPDPSATQPYPKRGTCTLPPPGWYCTLEDGHDGDTCPTVPEPGYAVELVGIKEKFTPPGLLMTMTPEWVEEESRNWLGRIFRVPLRKK